MRVLHLSDIHFGGEDSAAIAAVTRFVSSERPDIIVASGDLSLIGLQSELDAAFAWLSSLGPPIVATPGNHDVPYHELLPRFYRPFRRYERAAAAAKALDGWDDGAVRIITINTARGWQARPNWALGAISTAQRHHAVRLLRETPAHALKIIVTHHPLMFPPDSPLPGQTHGGKRAARRLLEAGAQIFLAGHLHTTMEATLHGAALSLGAGTLSQRLRGEPPGFLMFERTSDTTLALERYIIADGEVQRFKVDNLTFGLAPSAIAAASPS